VGLDLDAGQAAECSECLGGELGGIDAAQRCGQRNAPWNCLPGNGAVRGKPLGGQQAGGDQLVE